MNYDFDTIIRRRGTNAVSTDGYRSYLFGSRGKDMDLPYPEDELVRMWVADMDFAVADVILEAIRDRAKSGSILGYSKVSDPEYYEAFARWTQSRYGWHCEREEMFTTPGVVPALYKLVDYATKPGDKVLILTPSYGPFAGAVRACSRELVCSPLKNEGGYFTMDYEDIRQKAADPHTTLCLFCNPHNPSGRAWSEEELKRFGEICFANGVRVISDEIHCDLTRTGVTHIPFKKVFPDEERIVTCMAPSKTFNLAGLMISNIAIHDTQLRQTFRERYAGNDNPLSIAAAQAAYSQGGPWLEELRAYLDGNFACVAEYLQERLPKAVFRVPQATYLAWVDVSAYVSEKENLPLLFAQGAGVLLEGSGMFVGNDAGFIRLNLAMPRAQVQEGLRRICMLLANR